MEYKRKRKWHKRWWGLLLLVFLGLVAAGFIVFAAQVGYYLYQIRTGEFVPNPEPVAAVEELPEAALVDSADDPSLGSSRPLVTVVEFSDFQCPFCAQSHGTVREMAAKYGDSVRFVFRDFPLEAIHGDAVLAAQAGECAHEQGKFWAMHDRMFQNQSDLSAQTLKQHAVRIGLDADQFNHCLETGKYAAEVQEDFQAGVAAAVQGTPAWFFNGRHVAGILSPEMFSAIIESMLVQ